MKYVSPSIKETAFNCPHCGALAQQDWFTAHADPMTKGKLPEVIDKHILNTLNFDDIKNEQDRKWRQAIATKMAKKIPLFEFFSVQRDIDIYNIWYNQCYNCEGIGIWICDRMIFPQLGEAPLANPDMPDDIRRDYDEARAILDLSPRGAAALIRLAIQKLCKELGQPGKNINDDIGALVKSGLDPRIQQALDVVRVIGNSAVHPGQIDLRDDRATAETLFKLLNLIVDKTISEPKHVKEMYDALPESQLKAIERRDGKSGT